MWACGALAQCWRLRPWPAMAVARGGGERGRDGWRADPGRPGRGLARRLHAQFTEIAWEQAWTRPDKHPHLFRPAGERTRHGRRHGSQYARALPERSWAAARLCPRTGLTGPGFHSPFSPLRLDCLVGGFGVREEPDGGACSSSSPTCCGPIVDHTGYGVCRGFSYCRVFWPAARCLDHQPCGPPGKDWRPP